MINLFLALLVFSSAILIPVFINKTCYVVYDTCNMLYQLWLTRRSTTRYLVWFPAVLLVAIYEAFYRTDGIVR